MKQQLCELPEGWEWTNLGGVLDVRDGTHDSPKYQQTGYPLVTSKNLKVTGLDIGNVKYISQEDFLHISKRSGVDRGEERVELGYDVFLFIKGGKGDIKPS